MECLIECFEGLGILELYSPRKQKRRKLEKERKGMIISTDAVGLFAYIILLSLCLLEQDDSQFCRA